MLLQPKECIHFIAFFLQNFIIDGHCCCIRCIKIVSHADTFTFHCNYTCHKNHLPFFPVFKQYKSLYVKNKIESSMMWFYKKGAGPSTFVVQTPHITQIYSDFANIQQKF